MARVTSEGAHKTGVYPFWSINIVPRRRILVKSAKHRRELMRQHGLNDARDYSKDSIVKRKRWFKESQKEKRRKDIEGIYKEVRGGKVDMRKRALSQKKSEFEIRNYGKVL